MKNNFKWIWQNEEERCKAETLANQILGRKKQFITYTILTQHKDLLKFS